MKLKAGPNNPLFLPMIVLLIGMMFVLSAYGEEAPLTGEAYVYADAAYKALAEGNSSMAEQQVRKALAIRPDSRQLGLLLLDTLIRQAKIEDARNQADLLLVQSPDDAQLLAQRGFLLQRQQLYQEAILDFSRAAVIGLASPEQKINVRLSWADCAQALNDAESVLTALSPLRDANNYAIQIRLANAMLATGNPAGAREAARIAEMSAESEEQRAVASHFIEQVSAPSDPVRSDQAIAPFDGRSHLDKAYAFLAAGQDRQALDAFKQAFDEGQGSAGNYADAGYAAIRLEDNRTAADLFTKALDANASMAPDKRVFDEQAIFGYRRAIESLSRTGGLVVSLSYQSNGFDPQNSINVLQGGLEAYLQPEGIGNRNGKILQLFARGYETLYDRNGGRTGTDTMQGSVGVRYKPLSDWNVVLTAEKLFRIGKSATDDWLLRAAYSTGMGSDLQPLRSDWQSWQIYIESAYFLKAKWFIQNLEASYGHSFRMDTFGDRFVFYPHIVAAVNYDSLAKPQTTLGVGPGIGMRYWFREDKYKAPASYVDLTLQYRFELTKSRRAKGLVARGTLWY